MQHNLILPNFKEIVYGRRYLLFQLVFLGSFISLALMLMGWDADAVTLNLLYFAVNFIVTVLLCRKFLRHSLSFGLQTLGSCLWQTALGFCGYQVLMQLVGMLILWLEPSFANVNDQTIAQMTQGNFPLMVVGTVLLVPVTEEVLYRGIVFGGLYRRSRVAAYVVSTLVFALVHITGYIGSAEPMTLLLCFLQYIPAGVCLAVSFDRSGSILTPILIHTAVNAMGMMAMR